MDQFISVDSMIGGYVQSQLVYVVAKLGLADLTWQTPCTIEELAALVNVNADALRRVMAMWVAFGIFERKGEDSYQLAAGHEILLSDHPNSIRSYAIVSGEFYYKAFSELLYSVQTGKTGCEQALGKDHFVYLNEHPDTFEHFNTHMSRRMRRDAEAAITVYDFSPYKHVVDIGGGNGTFLSLLLQKYPSMQATLFDLPITVEQARGYLQQTGVAERCQTVGGDFFADELPKGGDLYILALILHDWNDEQALRILQNCRQAISNESKLIIIEFAPQEQELTAREAGEDLSMLVLTGGCERTAEQFRLQLAKANFQLTKVVPTQGRRSVIEALPITHQEDLPHL